jgi:hypothetical protein
MAKRILGGVSAAEARLARRRAKIARARFIERKNDSKANAFRLKV